MREVRGERQKKDKLLAGGVTSNFERENPGQSRPRTRRKGELVGYSGTEGPTMKTKIK